MRFKSAILAVSLLFAATFTLQAETPAPTGAPPVTQVAPLAQQPSQQQQPAQPQPAQQQPQPAAVQRREEEVPQPGATNQPPAPNSRLSVFQRAASYLQGREALAHEISSRDRTITDLRAQLAERDRTISQQNSELAELRTGRDQLQNAVNALEGQRTTVTNELASLGFPANQLPAAGHSAGEHVFDQWHAAQGAEKTKLWREHRTEIRAEGERRAAASRN